MHAVILDVDGTLVDSATDDDRIYREAVCAVLGDIRLRPSLHDYTAVTDTGILLQVMEDNGIEHGAATLAEVREEFVTRIAAHIDTHGPFPELPGARGFVARLRKSQNHAVAIATGGWGETAQLKLHAAGFELAGIPLLSSNDASRRADIMRLAFAALRGDFDSITYLGDGNWDRTATAELGWRFQPVGPLLGGWLNYDEATLPGE